MQIPYSFNINPTVSYAVNNNIYDKLLKSIEQNYNEPIDDIYCNRVSKYATIIGIYPFIAHTGNFKSIIS